MWILISGAVGGFVFIANKIQKKEITNLGWKALASAVIGGAITFALMSVNHIQGV
jgi:hypothetical protein